MKSQKAIHLFQGVLLAVGLVVTSLIALPASASTITDNVTFSAPFTSPNYGGGTGSSGYTSGATPVAVTGSFTITFDPTQTYTDDTAGITNPVLTGITSSSAFAFDYSPNSYVIGSTTFAAGELVVGGVNDGACCILLPSSTNDFYLQILTFATSPTFQQVGYATANDDYFYTLNGSSGGSVTVTPQTTTTPEPGTLVLFGGGLLGVAGLIRRKVRL